MGKVPSRKVCQRADESLHIGETPWLPWLPSELPCSIASSLVPLSVSRCNRGSSLRICAVCMWCVQIATPMTVRKAFSKVSLKRWIVSYYLGAAYRYILCFVYTSTFHIYSFTVDSFDLFWFHDFHLQGRGKQRPATKSPSRPAKLADYGGSKSILGRSTTFQLWKLL